MCITACPVKIDTGLLMKELDRAEATFISRGRCGLSRPQTSRAPPRWPGAPCPRQARSPPRASATRGLLRGGSAVLNTLAPTLFPKLDAKVPLPLPCARRAETPRRGRTRSRLLPKLRLPHLRRDARRRGSLHDGSDTPLPRSRGIPGHYSRGHRVVVLRPRFLEQVSPGGRRCRR